MCTNIQTHIITRTHFESISDVSRWEERTMDDFLDNEIISYNTECLFTSNASGHSAYIKWSSGHARCIVKSIGKRLIIKQHQILDMLLSRAALPASSNILAAVRQSGTAAM